MNNDIFLLITLLILLSKGSKQDCWNISIVCNKEFLELDCWDLSKVSSLEHSKVDY